MRVKLFSVFFPQEARPRLSKTKRKNVFSTFLFVSREARFCFRERHGCAFARVTAVPLGNEKNVFSVFFSFARVTVLLPREARLCFRESHGRASRKGKNKTRFLFFFFRESHGFASARGTVVLTRKSRPCLSEREKNTRFLFFFLSRESRFCFRERHGCAFARVTAVPLGKGKTKRVFCFFLCLL